MSNIGALVAYKGKPAKIIASTTHKYEISFSDGSTQKVREKDFHLIHPEFSNVTNQFVNPDTSILNDLEVDSLSLKEATEWLFEDFTCQNAWCVNLMAEDSLYFYWSKDSIMLRTLDQVKVIEKQRNDKAIEKISLEKCIDNLNKNTFKTFNVDRSRDSLIKNDVMTVEGTVNKTAISLSLLMVAGYYSYTNPQTSLMWLGLGIGIIAFFITFFKKKLAPITTPIYSLSQGLALGGISYIYAQQFEGIVFNAVSLTAFILLSLLFAYKSKLIKPSDNLKLGIFAATSGIAVFYLIGFIGMFLGYDFQILNPTNGSITSILISLFIVVIASLNLVLDFDFIEEASENGAPKYMEWYAAFGLMVTLVWLYLEILRLLAKINSRD